MIILNIRVDLKLPITFLIILNYTFSRLYGEILLENDYKSFE